MGQLLRATAIAVFCLGLISAARADPFTFTEITVPGSISTEAFGINDSGEIVGSANFRTNGQSEQRNGFIENGSTFTTISNPGSTITLYFRGSATQARLPDTTWIAPERPPWFHLQRRHFHSTPHRRRERDQCLRRDCWDHCFGQLFGQRRHPHADNNSGVYRHSRPRDQ